MNVLQLVPLVLAWLPHVIAAVSVVEAVFGSGKSGSEKRALVIDFLRSTAEKLHLPWGDAAIRAIELVIDAVVGILNFVGAFRHGVDVEPEVQQAARLMASAPASTSNVALDDPALIEFKNRLRVGEK